MMMPYGFTRFFRKLQEEKILLSIMFIFLISSLFLGDGKQPFVDAWWALGILMMYGVRYYQRGKLDLRPLPSPTGLAWTALILYYIILIPFSDSAGYSITTTIRIIEAYLVYVLFATISSDPFGKLRVNVVELFTKGVLFVGAVATLASFVFLLVPSWVNLLPSMNLLYATYGHNHLADLLLFIFPVAIGLVEKKRNILSVGLLALFTLGMLLTFARGAWVLLVLYLLFLAWKSKSAITRRVGLFVAAATVAVFLLVSLRTIPTQKPSLLEDGRWEYWRQSVEAIKERPPFGSGPGTFYLESKRLQSAPSSWSWFAHSFPLQITVETGVVGLAILSFLFWNVFQRSKPSLLLWGAALVLVYSLYEFTLDYATIWLLVWAALGVLLKHDVQEHTNSRDVAGALVILVLFYVSSISSLIASTVANNKAVAFLVAPYDTNTAKELLEKQKKEAAGVTSPQIPITTFFHNANPDIYTLFVDLTKDETEKQRRKELVVSLDPWKRNEYDVVGYYIQRRELGRAREELEKTLDLWEKAKKRDGQEADHAKKQELSKQMLAVGDGLFLEKKPTEAAAWYVRAQEVDAWALDTHPPVFSQYAAPAQDKLAFFGGLTAMPGAFLGRHKEEYAAAWQSALMESLHAGDTIDVSRHTEGVIHITPWAHSQLWQTVGLLLIQKAEEREKSGQVEQAAGVLLQAFALWESLTSGDQQVDWELQLKIASLLARASNRSAPRNLLIAEKTYGAALSMVPWIGGQIAPWYKQYSFQDIETPALRAYVNSDTVGGQWEQLSNAHATLFLVDKMVDEDKPQEALRYANFIAEPRVIDYSERKGVVVKLQKRADELLEDNRQQDAAALLTSMGKILSEDYWIQAQQGYFYIVVGDAEKARQSFGECLVVQLGRHKDCALGIREINVGYSDKNRYSQISLIIQRKKTWQDFVQ